MHGDPGEVIALELANKANVEHGAVDQRLVDWARTNYANVITPDQALLVICFAHLRKGFKLAMGPMRDDKAKVIAFITSLVEQGLI